jgi:hypothetical protein
MRLRLGTCARLAAFMIVLGAAGADVAAQPPADDTAALRRQVLARFEVVPLRTGVALIGRSRDRRFEIVDGLVLDNGSPLSGAELRQRLGADAALVLRLSYLDNAALRTLFAPAPVAPSAPAAAPAASPPPPEPPPVLPVPTPAPPSVAGPPPAAPPDPAPPARTYRRSGARLAFGKDVMVAEDEEVTDSVVALGGRIRVAGRVRDEIVAVGGDVELLPTADVRGDITAVGGRVTIAPGARHTGRIHHPITADWPEWSWPLFGWSRLDLSTSRWLTLAGTLTRVGLLAAAVSLVVLLGRTRVGRIEAAASAAPLKAGAIGFGLQVLFVPVLVLVSLVLAITIVGLPFVAVVIPLALVTMFLAMLLGFTSLAHALGGWTARRLGWDATPAVWVAVLGVLLIVLPTVLSRLVGVAPEALRAGAVALLVIGTAVEYVAWTVGLGAAAMTGLGRWATAPPPIPPPVGAEPAVL